MAHLQQHAKAYQHAHQMYATAAIPAQKQAMNTQQQKYDAAYSKAIRSIQATLEHPSNYVDTFVINEISKVGQVYAVLKQQIGHYMKVKNGPLANAKNQELGVYIAVIKKQNMYQTLCKLLSPMVGHKKSIQAEAAKTLSIIAHRPNRYRDSKWYDQKQKHIALAELHINDSEYNTLILISYILIQFQHGNDVNFFQNTDNVRLIGHTLRLLANVVNHNSDVVLKCKQYEFISHILQILNDEKLFQFTLKAASQQNHKNKEDADNARLCLLLLTNGISAVLNLIQHNEANRIQFCRFSGWNFICKCLKHPCMEVRELSLCFINTVCVSSKLSSKYFLNAKWKQTESFKLLLLMIARICANMNIDESNKQDTNNVEAKKMYKKYDALLCKLVNVVAALCNENMMGYRKFCFYKSWKVLRKLLQCIMNVHKHSTYQFSNTLFLQIFALLTCFNVPKQFEQWKMSQYDVLFSNKKDPLMSDANDIAPKKKLTMKERKLRAKREEESARKEFKKIQRIIKETVRMLGGYCHSTESPSPEPKDDDIDDEDDEEDKDDEQDEDMADKADEKKAGTDECDGDQIMADEEDESFSRHVILKFLVTECLSRADLVTGAICTIGKLCKHKYDGNIKRFDHILEDMKREQMNVYKACVNSIADDTKKKIVKNGISSSVNFKELSCLVSGLNDIFDAIALTKTAENQQQQTKYQHVRQLIYDSHIFYLLCMIITSRINQFFTSINAPTAAMAYSKAQHTEQLKVQKLNEQKAKEIEQLKLLTCYGLHKLIRFDVNGQEKFMEWLPRIFDAMKNMHMSSQDHSYQKIALTFVIQAACFKPINQTNIAALHKYSNFEHTLNEIYKEIQPTSTH